MAEQLAELNKGELEVYSTTEQAIGIDANGNIIYRKTYRGTCNTPSVYNEQKTFSVALGVNYREIKKSYGWWTIGAYSNLQIPTVMVNSAMTTTLLFTDVYGGTARLTVNKNSFSETSATYEFTIEYTKS